MEEDDGSIGRRVDDRRQCGVELLVHDWFSGGHDCGDAVAPHHSTQTTLNVGQRAGRGLWFRFQFARCQEVSSWDGGRRLKIGCVAGDCAEGDAGAGGLGLAWKR